MNDHVWVPANWAFPRHIATVVELGSSYVGPLAATNRRTAVSAT